MTGQAGCRFCAVQCFSAPNRRKCSRKRRFAWRLLQKTVKGKKESLILTVNQNVGQAAVADGMFPVSAAEPQGRHPQ